MSKRRVVYSTNPDWQPNDSKQQANTLPNEKQKLRVLLEKKGRRGKSVTLITGFVGTEDDLKTLAKTLKSQCGTGGSAKDGEIVIQGDKRDQIVKLLLDADYGDVKKSGG